MTSRMIDAEKYAAWLDSLSPASRAHLDAFDDDPVLSDGRPWYYDRDGEPLRFSEWCFIREFQRESARVASTLVGEQWVSTVWIGYNHQFLDGPPLIFETMTFGADDEDQEQWRYTTEAQALAGHQAVVARLAAELGVEPIEDWQPDEVEQEHP